MGFVEPFHMSAYTGVAGCGMGLLCAMRRAEICDKMAAGVLLDVVINHVEPRTSALGLAGLKHTARVFSELPREQGGY